MASKKQELTRLTGKHRKYVRKRAAGESIKDSSGYAGFSHQYGRELACQPIIKTAIVKAMDDAGINDSYLAKKVKQGLNAKTVPKSKGGKRYDDQFVRKQWADITFKLRGDYAPEKSESTHSEIVLIINDRRIKGLRDSGAISEDEAEILEAEIIKEEK